MNCDCHDVPCYWQKDKRLSDGGRWECRVKRSGYNRAAYLKNPEKARRRFLDRYDNDPVFRIHKNLMKQKRARAERLKQRREALHGPLQN